MQKVKLFTCLLCFIMLSFTHINAQTGTIQISGNSIPSSTPTGADLLAMRHITLEAKGHDEQLHHYDGVLLSDILSKIGVHLGENVKKTTAASYVLVKAADHYSCLFALAEVDPLFTDKTIILGDKQDGQALAQQAGPFQIIVPGEKKHVRWIRQVISIQVITTS